MGQMSKVSPVIFVASILCFLFPFLTISCGGQKVALRLRGRANTTARGSRPRGLPISIGILLSPDGIRVDRHRGRKNPRRHPRIAKSQSHGVARLRYRISWVRLWGFRRSGPRDGGDGRPEKKVVAWSCSSLQPGACVYRSGRSRTRVGLPGTSLRPRFTMDGVAQERPYLRSAPFGASLCSADEEAAIR